MIRRIDMRGMTATQGRDALPRNGGHDAEVTVQPILDAVRSGGADAVLELAERFDGVRPAGLRVPAEVLETALRTLDPAVRAALEEAIRRARTVHRSQRRADTTTTLDDGAQVTDRWVPVHRVGLYAPGGRAVYPSSVVMNVVPAQEAGVRSLAIASPPQRDNDGWPHPTVLAAARLLGVDEVYAVGGAQAIAMFTYGVDDVCPPVAMITGPGNAYVAAAKRLVRGTVGVDADAGPTEVAILADSTADAGCVAADMISQAEHDEQAAAVLVTSDVHLAAAVENELQHRVPKTKHAQRISAALDGAQSAIVLVDDLEQGLDVVNAYGAEHLEIHTEDAEAVAQQVTNAGAVFVGPHSPVSVGDYCAGSNHVLPTGGTAAFSSGLSVQTFLRGIQVISYNEAGLRAVAAHVVTLADAEDLPAHGQAVTERFARDDTRTGATLR